MWLEGSEWVGSVGDIYLIYVTFPHLTSNCLSPCANRMCYSSIKNSVTIYCPYFCVLWSAGHGMCSVVMMWAIQSGKVVWGQKKEALSVEEDYNCGVGVTRLLCPSNGCLVWYILPPSMVYLVSAYNTDNVVGLTVDVQVGYYLYARGGISSAEMR